MLSIFFRSYIDQVIIINLKISLSYCKGNNISNQLKPKFSITFFVILLFVTEKLNVSKKR